MIKLTATALINYISPTQEIPSKSGGTPFIKRELVLDDSYQKDGKTYTNYVPVEFSGDKCAILDQFAPGQRVTVEAYVNGREYNGRFYTSIRGQSVTLAGQPQQGYQPYGQPMQQPYQPYGQPPSQPYGQQYAPPAVQPPLPPRPYGHPDPNRAPY